MANRLVELAIEALEARKASIDEEIRKLRVGLRAGRRRADADNGLAQGRRRRMTAAVGHPTLRLLRVQIGDLQLGDLAAGAWRVCGMERMSGWGYF